ncbi:MAG: succinyldiaminopimelate transaminase [Deltaproteobacteria bacterium]|nr:succinyldiaminopimelate transaminase [Deltaproteobacteria bacterium]
MNPTVQKLATYPAEALMAKKQALLAAGKEVYDFSVGDPIEPTAEGIRQAFMAGLPSISQYPSIVGEPAFRQACGDWLKRRFDVSLDVDAELIPSTGSKEAIFHLPLTFLDPHGSRRRVLYGVPAYPLYERGARFAGGEPWPVELRPEKHYRLEPWDLPAEKIAETAICWINYPHNPTAATADLAYLGRLVAFCHQHDILLCSDECYADIYFEEPKPPSVLQVTREGVLAFHSLSKRSGMTGYRSGFVAGDAALIALLKKTRPNFGVATTRMVQAAASWAWRDEAHLEQRLALFRAKRDVMLRFCAERGIEHTPCTSTLYLWVRVPGDGDAVAYAERLAEKGIIVSPAPFHGVDQPYFRLALVPSVEDCERAMLLWGELEDEGA